MTLGSARKKPVHTILSGPAGGVVASAEIAARCKLANIITMDMGGTSTDISMIVESTPQITSQATLEGMPVRIPVVDINAIGAGGGSIAQIDEGDALRVGPQSAEAQPGPACYCRGGTLPTVTDANLLLGRLGTSTALGGELALDSEAAQHAIHKHIAHPLRMDVIRAAEGIIRVANANTAQEPWFSLDVAQVPWMATLTAKPRYTPEALRGAVLEFLAAFTPERNPATSGRTAFTPLERKGAERFEAVCETCHQARTVADDASTRLPAADWEAAIFDDGRVLWASEDRYRTGVEPYVHDDGARVPSLRRLWVKRPYLTQGSAADISAVLQAVRLETDAVHAGDSGSPLTSEDRLALSAFLDLL